MDESRLGATNTGMESVPVDKMKEFFVTYKDPTGKVFEGQFTCKKLTLREWGQVNVKKTHLNGGYYHDDSKPGVGIDEYTDLIHQMLAHLEIALVRWPMWWNVNTIDDSKLLMEIYQQVSSFESGNASPQREAAVNVRGSEVGSGSEGKESGAARRVTPVGGGEVQATLEP